MKNKSKKQAIAHAMFIKKAVDIKIDFIKE